MGSFIKNNPIWFSACVESLVVATLNAVLAFGVTVTMEQTAAINAVVVIATTLVLGLWAQTPIARLVAEAKAEGMAEGLAHKP